MLPPTDAAYPSFRSAREAARRARAAEHGPRAVDAVRPRGIFGLVRSRGPLAVVLYAASRQGRLVWQGADSFALLDPPRTPPSPWRGPRGLPDLLDRRWEFLVFAGPPAAGLLVSLLLAAAHQWLAAILVLPLTVLYVAVLMTAMVAVLLGGFIRGLATDPEGHRSADAEVCFLNWTMPLCHCPDDGRAPALLDAVAERLRLLVEEPTAGASDRRGTRAGNAEASDPLVCVLAGATTGGAEAAILAASDAVPSQRASVAFLPLGPRSRVRRPALMENGAGLALYTLAVAACGVYQAILLAGWEHDACAAASDCAERPATFGTALRWFVWRLAFQDPPGTTPATTLGWVYGALDSLLGFMFVPLVYFTLWRASAARREKLARRLAEVDMVLNKTVVLLLVATPTERNAVVKAVTTHNGAAPRRRHLAYHTVFDLGVVSNARVMLAQTRPGSLEPGAATLTAQSLTEQLDPHYLILTGICYGLHETKQRLGDVLVCTQLRVMDHKKIVEHREGEPMEILRGDRVSPSVTLLDRCQTARLEPVAPAVHFGPLLSANTLLDSPTTRASLAAAEPDAIGGEMEGLGVYAAAAKGRAEWIVVKAICDWGMDKDDAAQAFAARNAAEFVLDVLSGGGLDKPAGQA
ncbi:hypothetical protein ACQP2K_25955 [Microbispora siamensis]